VFAEPRLLRWATFCPLVFLLSCGSATGQQSTPQLDTRAAAITAITANQTPETLSRRARSVAILIAEGVPVSKTLPVIQDEAASKRRSTEDVVLRAVALYVVALKGVAIKQAEIDQLVREYRLGTVLTRDEQAFVSNPAPSWQDLARFSWRFEAGHVLLWSAGLVDPLVSPHSPIDPGSSANLIRRGTRAALLARAKARPLATLLDQADLAYRYHWAVVEARVNHVAPPKAVNADVIMERHAALNWLIGYMEQDWDEVTTDT
jgi:Domain of unknown function (DUF4272)